jgi:hypothetical protein
MMQQARGEQARAQAAARDAAARAQEAAQAALKLTAESQAQTSAELDALVAKRGELQAQLRDLTNRRETVAQQSVRAPDAATAQEFQARLREIDTRSMRIERDIQRLDDQIADAVGRGVFARREASEAATTTVPPPPPGGVSAIQGNIVARLLIGEAVMFVLMGLALWRFGWRRVQAQLSHFLGERSHNVERLQQSIDVIAVEVERIAEGQRYVAKVLGAGQASAVPAPSAREKVVP